MRRRATWITAALVSALLVCAAPAGAASFDVTTPQDGVGPCDADCTLREAVIAANATPGLDAITLHAETYEFSAGGLEEDAAATGDLDLTDDVLVTGAGPDLSIVDARAIDRGFDVAAGAKVGVSGVTVRNGFGPRGGPGGAGIRNAGELELTRVVVAQNSAQSGGGGGILSDGTLTLTDVAVADNEAFVDGGILSHGTATLTNVTVSATVAWRARPGSRTAAGRCL